MMGAGELCVGARAELKWKLVEVRLNDVGAAAAGSLLALGGARRSEEELRLVYSAVVVRAVNGLTGHEQKVHDMM